MGERKVLNKYIPADFDPKLVPRGKRDWSKPVEVRMMLPFSLQCNTCGEYMYRGKKFNSRKEDVKGEDYLGIRKYRFYIKCVVCSAEITFKTDPEHGDYECESGASRNFEAWRDPNEPADVSTDGPLSRDDKADAIATLESRTMDSKLEMDILDALDEIKAINQRHERVDTDKLLERLDRNRTHDVAGDSEQTTEDDAKALEAFRASRIKRLEDDDDGDTETKSAGSVVGNGLSSSSGAGNGTGNATPELMVRPSAKAAKPSSAVASAKPKISFVKRKKAPESTGNAQDNAKKPKASVAVVDKPAVQTQAAAVSSGLPLSTYDSSSGEEES